MTALLSVGLLVALSLLRSIDMGPPMFYWTFVVEERYYAFPLLFIGILAWYWLFVLPAHSPGKKILSYLLVGTIAIEMLHGIYFLSKKLTGPLPSISESGWARPQMAFTKQFILEEQAKGNKVIVTSYVRQFGFMAGWLGAGALFEPLKINTATFASDGPAVLLAVIDKKELGYFKPFLQRPGVRWVHSTADYYFYTLYVGTGTNL
jgi:hypothetical protein